VKDIPEVVPLVRSGGARERSDGDDHDAEAPRLCERSLEADLNKVSFTPKKAHPSCREFGVMAFP
jgi:hypothetical protein